MPAEAQALRATWRVAAAARCGELRTDLARLPESKRGTSDYRTANTRLTEAENLISAGYGWRAIVLFYTGGRIELAWAALHDAERAIIMLLDADAARARVPWLRRAIAAYFPARGADRRGAKAIADKIEREADFKPAHREQLRSLLELAHRYSDDSRRDVRAYRNVLLMFSFVLGCLLVIVALVPLLDRELISVCAPPDDALKGDLCLQGGVLPGRADLAALMLAGAVGGLVGAVVRLSQARRLRGPYGLAVAQTALKVVTGAALAFVGVLLLQKGLLVGLSRQTGTTLVAYAAFFGIAQQVLTTLVDRRVAELAKKPDADDD